MEEIYSWQNGNWIKNSEIGTKLWDAHYFFGWAVFDAFRTYNHVPHLLHEHLDRLYTSAKLSSIKIEYSKKDLIDIIHKVMKKNIIKKEEEYRFMIFASPGYFKIYDDMGDIKPILTVNVTTCSRYSKHITPYLEKGVVSLISTQPQIPSRYLNPKIKSCSRLHYGLADSEASRFGPGVYPILLDEHGYISESSGSNVGFIKNNKIYLPNENNILRGCTIKFIERIAKENNIDIIHGNWEVYDLIESNSIFYTSTFTGLVPSYKLIYRNEEILINKNIELIDKLQNIYSHYVGIDIIKQWKNWYGKLL